MTTRSPEERQEFGRKLRKARQLRTVSHDWLARETGTGRQHLIRLEKGKHWPSDDLVERIGKALELPITYFVGDPTEAVAKAHRETIAAAFETIADELLELAKLGVTPANISSRRRRVGEM